MSKYTFKILPTTYTATQGTDYNEVDQKILNQSLEEIRIIVESRDMREAFELAKKELMNIVAYNFGDVPHIDNYNFRLRLIEVYIG